MPSQSEACLQQGVHRLIFESSIDGVVVTDGVGRVLQANRPAREYLLEDIEKLLRGGDDGEPAIRAFRAGLRATGAASVELRLQAVDGKARSVAVVAAAGDACHVLVLRDMTERRSLEHEVERLRRADSVGRHTSGIVDELAEALAPLACLSALLLEELDPVQRASSVARELHALAERAAELTRQIRLVAPACTPSGRELPRGSETILVVEDDDRVRAVVRTVLEEQGYGVLDAASGELALAELADLDRNVDLLLVDVVMPGMNGRVLLEKLRDSGHAVKVLFMSGHTDKAIADHGVTRPEDPLLRKAFSPSALARKVREVLEGRSAA